MLKPKATSLCGMIFVLGGSTDRCEQGALASVELFPLPLFPRRNPSPSLPDLSFPRRSPALFHFPCGHLLTLGGCSAPGQHLNCAEILEDCSSLNEADDRRWRELANDDINNIQGFSCAAFGQIEEEGTGFVFGGFDGRECLQQVIQIEPDEPHTCKLLKPLPYGLKNSAAVPAVESDKFFLVGGWDGKRTLATILEYDLRTGACVMKAQLPYTLEGHSIAKPSSSSSQRPFAFIVGGFDGIGVRDDILLMDRRTGKVVNGDETRSLPKLTRARENCAALCFKIEEGEAEEDQRRGEWLAVIGGWDAQKALDDWELFEVLSQSPWLQKIGNNSKDWTKMKRPEEDGVRLKMARNRAAAIFVRH